MPPQQPGARATFVSTTEKRFDVRLDDNAVCTTPCSIYVEPLRYITMHSHEERGRPTKLSVGHLPAGDLMITAKPRSEGLFATGVTFTSLGSVAAVTGITLAAVGCSGEDRRELSRGPHHRHRARRDLGSIRMISARCRPCTSDRRPVSRTSRTTTSASPASSDPPGSSEAPRIKISAAARKLRGTDPFTRNCAETASFNCSI
jgi:hypothetical protein